MAAHNEIPLTDHAEEVEVVFSRLGSDRHGLSLAEVAPVTMDRSPA